MKKRSIVAISVSSFILILEIVINIFVLAVYDDLISQFIFKPEVDSNAVEQANGEELARQIEADGIVLVKNENNALPLDLNYIDAVNVFGWSSTQWVGGGSGSGRVVNSNGEAEKVDTGILEAFEEYGVLTNTELSDFYRSFSKSRPNKDTLHSWAYEYYRLIEPKMSEYSQNLLDNAKQFSDTAVVVIGRVGGESSDAPRAQYKGTSNSATANDPSRTYLEISTEEEEMLRYCGKNFENCVVIVNSVNTMELGFLNTIPGIDGCLIVGGTGVNGAAVIPDVLFGDINPSGRLSDTYAYELESNPAFVNSGAEGERIFKNSNSKMYPTGEGYGNVSGGARYEGARYVDYDESIYLGYKWYETANQEGYFKDVNNDYGKGYNGVVQYPFGYGLSYNDGFTWEIIELSHNNGANINKEDTITLKVRVTNTGDIPGKDVVELYYTPTYTKGGIEKAHVNLCAFGKTEELEPGSFQDIELSVRAYDMASYDCYDMNNNTFKGYELEKGKYELKLMKNAHELHEVVSTISSAHKESVISLNVTENIRYENDPDTNNVVKNRFTGSDAIDGAPIDGSSHDGSKASPLKRLSRSDFKKTFPKSVEDRRDATEEQLEYNLYKRAHADKWREENDKIYTTPVTTGADSGMKIFKNQIITDLGLELGGNFESEKWDALLNQMTFGEMMELTLHGYTQTKPVPSIGKPACRDLDGPAQIGSFNANVTGTGFPNETLMAQTWNQRLVYDFGMAVGIESKAMGVDGWYGPGINMHRTPFGGRNYEYYSEDAYLTGIMGANAVKGAKNAGVYCYLKHLAVYDQEEYRDGLYTFLDEQALREIYLKPFKMAIATGGATGIMTSYNRLGCVWAGGSEALLTKVVREEWGFNGTILTDYSDHQNFMSMDHAIRNGGDLWMDGVFGGSYKYETKASSLSNSMQHTLRNASKHIIYTFLNAYYQNNKYNEEGDDSHKIEIGAKKDLDYSWKAYVYIADAVIDLPLILWVGLSFKKKKEVTVE